MDPLIFEFIGGMLLGSMVGLMVVLRTRSLHHSPVTKTMPILAIRTPRSASSIRRRRNSALAANGRSPTTVTKSRKKAKNKRPDTATVSKTPDLASATTDLFDTCPSCGLQAPGSLLAEHFLGSPSHRNGPPKIVTVDPVEAQITAEAKEEDSRQSVRNLLQMLVPPRAFGRRHAHRSVSPISSMVKDLGPPHRGYR